MYLPIELVKYILKFYQEWLIFGKNNRFVNMKKLLQIPRIKVNITGLSLFYFVELKITTTNRHYVLVNFFDKYFVYCFLKDSVNSFFSIDRIFWEQN